MSIEFYGATMDAQKTIGRLLSLAMSGREQDWEFEFADPSRVSEMLNVYARCDLNYEEKRALALLILSSIDCSDKIKVSDTERASYVLSRDNDVLESMIFYWIDQNRANNIELIKKILRYSERDRGGFRIITTTNASPE